MKREIHVGKASELEKSSIIVETQHICFIRALSVYSMGDESSDEMILSPTRKNKNFDNSIRPGMSAKLELEKSSKKKKNFEFFLSGSDH